MYLHAQPNSSKNQIVGLHGDRLKIKLKSPPVDGKANECLIEFLSEMLEISKSKIHLIKGQTGREKNLFIEGLSKEFFLQKINL